MYRFTLPAYSSIFTAEAYAIYKALQVFHSKPHFRLIIFSDSKSVLSALKSNKVTHFIVYKIRNLLIQLHNREVKFCWIPGHVDNTHHDKVGLTAKEATTQGIETELLYLVQKFQRLIYNTCLGMWQEWSKCRGSFSQV